MDDLDDSPSHGPDQETPYALRARAEELVSKYGCAVLCGCPNPPAGDHSGYALFRSATLPRNNSGVNYTRQFLCLTCGDTFKVEDVLQRYGTGSSFFNTPELPPPTRKVKSSKVKPSTGDATVTTTIPKNITPAAFASGSENIRTLKSNLNELILMYDSESRIKDRQVGSLKKELEDAQEQIEKSDSRIKTLETTIEELNARVNELKEENENLKNEKKRFTEVFKDWLGEGTENKLV